MDIFHFEQLRIELLSNLSSNKSPLGQLLLLNPYFKKIIESKNKLVAEAYLTEFIPTYYQNLRNLNSIGIDPKIITDEIALTELLLESDVFNEYRDRISIEIKRIKIDIQIVNQSLVGNENYAEQNELSFPVNIHSLNQNLNYGQIETFSVKIHKNNSLSENKFLVIPSTEKIDTQLEEQINISWQIAVEFLTNYYKKPDNCHEVVLVFNHRFAQIEGYSLGLAITLGFIQELFKFYNTPLSLSLNGNVTFTGGFDSNKKIKPIGGEIINKKVETVFYSTINFFAIPEDDFITAKEKLSELKLLYPERKLKILNIEDFNDLMSQRQIVKIERANLSERTNKFIKKNRFSLILIAIIISMVGAYSFYKIDNNPYEFEIINNKVHIVNKVGKILWSTEQSFGSGLIVGVDDPYEHRIFDTDGDGLNEVILAGESGKDLDSTEHLRIACFSNLGDLIWQYYFSDSISTNNHFFDTRLYRSELLDIVKTDEGNVLLAVARHNYFPSAIYKLNVRTGERLEGTLWSQGHFRRGTAGDFNKDGKIDIFIGGINNAMESAFALLVEYENLHGQTPNREDKLFQNLPIANLNQYLLLNKTDIANYLNRRFNGCEFTNFSTYTNEYIVNTFEGEIKSKIGLVYRFNESFTKVKMQIGDDIQFVRDSLIIKGIINGPLTNNPLFSKICKNGIKKWDGKNFVPFVKNH